MLSAKSGGTRKEAEVGAGDCASLEEESEACSVEECKNFFCFENVGAVSGDHWMAVVNAISATKEKSRKDRSQEWAERK